MGHVVESWLVRAARRRPAHPAMPGTTYAELLAAADGAAGALREAGVRAGDGVGLVLPPGRAFVVALHAVQRAGAHLVPVDPRTPSGERARRLRGCALIVDAPLPEAPARAAPPGGALHAAHDLAETAIVVSTSGTSGPAKPIPLTYGAWLWSALGSGVALGCPPEERWLAALPLNHVGGLSILVRSAVAGTTAVVHEGWDTDRVLAELRDPGGPTVVSLVPTTLRRLLDAGLERPAALRWALLGGAPIPAGMLEEAAAAGVPVAPTYGLSEACSQVATRGAPLFCTRVRIASVGADREAPADAEHPAAPGEPGEVLVAGPTVAPAARGPDGWLRTGDLGALGEDGHLRITGRRAETIVSGGENVLPVEVEAVLEAHPDVVEAGVHGVADPHWGEAVRAAVVLRPGAAEPAEIVAWARERLLPFQVPRALEVRDALPRTASGKLLRRELG